MTEVSAAAARQPIERDGDAVSTLTTRVSDARTAELDVSVVLPCLDEVETVATCVRKAKDWFSKAGVSGEVIVVDNGSTDGSRDEALKAGARVIDEPRRGYGAAHLRGFAEARGEVIVMADADDTYDLLNLDALIAPLRDGYDMTVGNRLRDLEPGAMTWSHRVIGTPAITFLLSIFAGSRLNDSQCGLRAFTREAYEKMELRSSGMELASEMILKSFRRGLKVAEVAVPYAVRKGETKLNTFRDGWRHLRFLLLHTPHYLFLAPGLALLVLGLLALGLTLGANGGVTIGELTWQPVFAGGILVVVGTNALVIGAATHLYAESRGIIPEDWLTRAFRQHVSLERALALAGAIIAIGLALDGVIFYEWVSDRALGVSTEGLAAVAQTSLIVGANLALGGFLIALMDVE